MKIIIIIIENNVFFNNSYCVWAWNSVLFSSLLAMWYRQTESNQRWILLEYKKGGDKRHEREYSIEELYGRFKMAKLLYWKQTGASRMPVVFQYGWIQQCSHFTSRYRMWIMAYVIYNGWKGKRTSPYKWNWQFWI